MLPNYLVQFHDLPEVPAKTLNQMMQTCLQEYQVNPVSVPTRTRLPLATPVLLKDGTLAVICDHSATESQRYRVTWFDRHFWIVRRKWMNRSDFEVVEEKQTAEAVSGSAVA